MKKLGFLALLLGLVVGLSRFLSQNVYKGFENERITIAPGPIPQFRQEDEADLEILVVKVARIEKGPGRMKRMGFLAHGESNPDADGEYLPKVELQVTETLKGQRNVGPASGLLECCYPYFHFIIKKPLPREYWEARAAFGQAESESCAKKTLGSRLIVFGSVKTDGAFWAAHCLEYSDQGKRETIAAFSHGRVSNPSSLRGAQRRSNLVEKPEAAK